MKTKIVAIFFLLISISGFSQIKRELGTKFDYNGKDEKDLKVVLVDNYNHYMFSVINIDGGMMPTNKLIIRKFDQKNQLVDTFTEEFPHKDVFTLHNYLGSFEIGNEKLVVITDTYSNKTKKKELHKITFDKKTGTFDTTLISEHTFESLSKSGTAYAMVSQNKNYIGVVYSKFANKKVAEEHECAIIDGRTGDLLWQKNVSFPLLSFTDNVVLNDSGKFIFVRTTKETGSKNVLAIADGNTIENKDFGTEDVKIKKPLSFSVGPNDYLLAFDTYAHGVNRGEYGKILMYDVNAGKVLKNNFLENFNQIKDLNKVNFNTLFVQNDEIYVFVDCDFQSGTKPDPTFPNSTFKVPEYSNGYPSLLIFTMDGELKRSVDYKVLSFKEGNKSIGVQNIKGNFYLNTYVKGLNHYYNGIYQLNNGSIDQNIKRLSLDEDGTVITQFGNYLPEAKRLILAESYGDTKMAFINVTGIQL
ncbi:hypothetical protein [Flavobacterium sp. GT3P67]|uniref:hypothetical protein n=1 Tax=Flavobacterium sp. GT3P67 TaxID=2541722 RepID=UPI0010431B06|nr:hypothetical protein [Flavobacterium sp. GT3P67]TDE51444.1 hypothetical protein E0H99_12635 [Flavobacterium sp. GT3P67]